MQGDEKMDSNCNHPEEEKYSLKNKKVTSFDKIPFSQKIPSSQKMTAIQNMPDREQNRPPLNFNDTKSLPRRILFLISIIGGNVLSTIHQRSWW